MKKLFALLLPCLSVASLQAQVAISNPASIPDPSAMLDLKSTNRGFLMPRLASRTDVPSPATGLMVYETTSNAVWVYNGTAWVQLGSGGGASQWLTSGNHIYNGNTGNVGIGISNPAQKLEVAGDLTLNDGAPTLKFKRGSGLLSLSTVDFANADDAVRFRQQHQGSYFKIGRPATFAVENDLVFNLDDGFVGIGKEIPEERLNIGSGNVKLSGVAPLIKLEAAVGGTGSPIASLRYTPGLQFLREGSSTVLGKIEYVDTANFSNFLRLYTGNVARNDFTVNTDHNVGIGTADPQAKLHLLWGPGEQLRISGVDPIIQFTSHILTQEKKGYVRMDGNDMVIGTNTANNTGNFIVTTNGFQSIKADASGNVGIGLGSAVPAAKLHVAGKIFANAGGEAIRIEGPDPAINFFQSGTQRGYVYNTGNDMQIGTSNAAGKLFLNANKVQISTSVALPDGYRLGVGGKIYCEELRVRLQSSGWPDYVFSDRYQLMPLHQLKTFIAQNNHLPNIPKAAFIEKEGFEVGDMNKRLLEKVEELTLYILQLEQRISGLEKKTANPAKN